MWTLDKPTASLSAAIWLVDSYVIDKCWFSKAHNVLYVSYVGNGRRMQHEGA